MAVPVSYYCDLRQTYIYVLYTLKSWLRAYKSSNLTSWTNMKRDYFPLIKNTCAICWGFRIRNERLFLFIKNRFRGGSRICGWGGGGGGAWVGEGSGDPLRFPSGSKAELWQGAQGAKPPGSSGGLRN